MLKLAVLTITVETNCADDERLADMVVHLQSRVDVALSRITEDMQLRYSCEVKATVSE